ncbi:MAG: kynureninase, partial [Gemmatimonadetes bacterium 21-71-4]
MIDPLLAFRPEFPILERTTYLVSNSLGAMPRGVPDRLAEYVDEWAEQGVRAWGRAWWEMPSRVGNEIAPLIGADTGQIVMVGNVTLGQATVLSALDYPAERNRIVMTALDFPSVRYVYDRLATRLGAEIVVVPAAADGIGVDADAVAAAIDERTRLVCISHVLFRSAFVMDVAPIVRRAHAVGALVSLDAFHAVGVMPVDVKALGVDFLTAGVLKWLCGGPGGCFLYVAPGAASALEPSLTGWQAHAHPFAFEPEMGYTPGIYRWLNGTPSVPALYAAIEGPRIVKRAGVDAIRAKSMRQTARLIALADARGYPVNAPRDPARRGGTVAF